MLLGGCDRAIPSQHKGARQGAAAALFSSPSPCTLHPSRESPAFALPMTLMAQVPFFLKPIFKPVSAALILVSQQPVPVSQRLLAGSLLPQHQRRGLVTGFFRILGLAMVSSSSSSSSSSHPHSRDWEQAAPNGSGKRHPRGSVEPGPHQDLVLLLLSTGGVDE